MTSGAFVRQQSRFRGHPHGGPERHHLYVALACPWSQRAVIVRAVLGVEIGISYAHPYRDERGWAFTGGRFTDEVNGFEFLEQAYRETDPGYDGRVSVPVLWDTEDRVIVSNESADIVRIFNEWADGDLYPDELRAEIDELNEFVYENVNDGVYRTGFARTQSAYERSFGRLFDALDELDARLATRRYLMGGTITEADWRLFPTLLRFDPVYVGHFKCNLRRVVDYPQLSGYLRELYQSPGIAETVDMDHIKRHYYRTHPTLNPLRIVPVGPALDLTAPHGREHLS